MAAQPLADFGRRLHDHRPAHDCVARKGTARRLRFVHRHPHTFRLQSPQMGLPVEIQIAAQNQLPCIGFRIVIDGVTVVRKASKALAHSAPTLGEGGSWVSMRFMMVVRREVFGHPEPNPTTAYTCEGYNNHIHIIPVLRE